MCKHIVQITIVIATMGVVSAEAADDSRDTEYMNAVRGYVESVRSYRFSVTFSGEKERGVENGGAVRYDVTGNYNVVSDRDRGLWKMEVHEERSPLGERSNEEFAKLHAVESRTFNNTNAGTTEYIHKDLDFGGYAVLYGQHQNRDGAFTHHMQTLDPLRYVTEATRNRNCELIDVSEQSEGNVVITYRVLRNEKVIKRIELSKRDGLLPVHISGLRENGEVISDIRIAYTSSGAGPMVKAVTYVNRSGKGTLDYTESEYNPGLADHEFEVDIPFGARVLDHEGNMLVERFEPGTETSEKLRESTTPEVLDGMLKSVSGTGPGPRREAKRTATRNSTDKTDEDETGYLMDAGVLAADAGGGGRGAWMWVLVASCVGGMACAGLWIWWSGARRKKCGGA